MTKEEQYIQLLPQALSLVSEETDLIANMANLADLLHRTFRFWWTGFYRVCGEELILGHIACSSESRSKIVVPVWKDGKIIAVLDIDSEKLGTFDEVDRKYLEEICEVLTAKETFNVK